MFGACWRFGVGPTTWRFGVARRSLLKPGRGRAAEIAGAAEIARVAGVVGRGSKVERWNLREDIRSLVASLCLNLIKTKI